MFCLQWDLNTYLFSLRWCVGVCCILVRASRCWGVCENCNNHVYWLFMMCKTQRYFYKHFTNMSLLEQVRAHKPLKEKIYECKIQPLNIQKFQTGHKLALSLSNIYDSRLMGSEILHQCQGNSFRYPHLQLIEGTVRCLFSLIEWSCSLCAWTSSVPLLHSTSSWQEQCGGEERHGSRLNTGCIPLLLQQPSPPLEMLYLGPV